MTPLSEQYDTLVVGGGWFGLNIAEYFASKGEKVLVCERGDACMTRASYANQARIHNGYHYPRSILTAMRSRVSFPRFVKEFPECVVSDFVKYYAIGKLLGKVNARQFAEFCRRIGAECEEAEHSFSSLFDSNYIEKVFHVREYAFDSRILCRIILKRLADVGVEIVFRTSVKKVSSVKGGDGVLADIEVEDGKYALHVRRVFNCTYSNLNFINFNSGFPLIPLKYEMTEMALVEIPDELQGKSVTVMCGPFFSLMPFPPRGLYSLSHVRYTPHYEWYDDEKKTYISPLTVFEADPKETMFVEMASDAARYLPIIRKCKQRDSIWEVKTVLPASETDDSRPILFMPNYCIRGYHCVMGGKIDNVYDVVEALENHKDII